MELIQYYKDTVICKIINCNLQNLEIHCTPYQKLPSFFPFNCTSDFRIYVGGLINQDFRKTVQFCGFHPSKY